MDNPTALRPAWKSLPWHVRDAVAAQLGATIVSAATQAGGFTHGVAARLRLTDGSRAFVKAIAATDPLAAAYRGEAAAASQLPMAVPSPRLRFSTEVSGWIVLIFDDIEGSHPRLETPAELAEVSRALNILARELTPNPVPGVPLLAELLGAEMKSWRHYAATTPPADLDDWSRRHLDLLAGLESAWEASTTGDTLLHADIRPDNMLRRTTDGTVFVVDWAWPCQGAAWVDLVGLMPSAAERGLDPDTILAKHPISARVDPAAITAFIVALAGYWTHSARQPAVLKSPSLRRHQAQKAHTVKTWLSRRLRLPAS